MPLVGLLIVKCTCSFYLEPVISFMYYIYVNRKFKLGEKENSIKKKIVQMNQHSYIYIENDRALENEFQAY